MSHLAVELLESAVDQQGQLPLFKPPPRPPAEGGARFKFIDLFAGIGGFRLGLEAAGGECVYSCEWDRWAQVTYRAWFGENPVGDIREVKAESIPDHDVLAAGFPCQPFSIAGVSKKKSLGREHGFRDRAQGTLFFEIIRIIEAKRPPAIILENVKNLLSHDRGRTWEVIRGALEDLDYKVFPSVIDAASWVPQHRERIFVVGFDRRVFGDNPPYEAPTPPREAPPTLASILDPNPDPRYTLSKHLWKYLQDYAKKHRDLGHGFGFGLADLNGVTRTLSARYYKDGSEILIPQAGRNPRRLTPREAARLMGFPDKLEIAVSDTQAYKQFGNAVVPLVVAAVARRIVPVLAWQVARSGNGCLLKRPPSVAS
ncbi:MAG: DNA (cytosine-5-)-methyltransferase [Planctomycetia bacterium]|nr:DNA (cytosine-5-)-methyltransferase [Planctomycetia bacterium]